VVMKIYIFCYIMPSSSPGVNRLFRGTLYLHGRISKARNKHETIGKQLSQSHVATHSGSVGQPASLRFPRCKAGDLPDERAGLSFVRVIVIAV
jgi:hypothetical protein